jgi:hypothetical protein
VGEFRQKFAFGSTQVSSGLETLEHSCISHSKMSCSADRQNDLSYHGYFEESEHAGNDLASQLAAPRTPSAPRTPLVTMSSDVDGTKTWTPKSPLSHVKFQERRECQSAVRASHDFSMAFLRLREATTSRHEKLRHPTHLEILESTHD